MIQNLSHIGLAFAHEWLYKAVTNKKNNTKIIMI
jgi:hypothetical protein